MTGEIAHVWFVYRDDCAFDFVGQATKIATALRQISTLHGHLADEFAVIAHLHGGKFFSVGGQHVRHTAQQRTPRAGGHARPRPIQERVVSRVDREINVRGSATCDLGPGLGGIRIDGLEIHAASRGMGAAGYMGVKSWQGFCHALCSGCDTPRGICRLI